jgi:hypothetical protein
MSRAQVQALVSKLRPPPCPFEQGYLDAGDGRHKIHVRLDYAQALYPRDWFAQREYLDGWLMFLAEEERYSWM